MRSLSPDFMDALKSGLLAPLLDAVKTDRDLILEIRKENVDIYCKGQVAIHLTREGGGFGFSCSDGFWDESTLETIKQRGSTKTVILTAEQMATYLNYDLPRIKYKIATHRKHGTEIEFEQLLVRTNSFEKRLSTDYFAIDRQSVSDGTRDRVDVTGVCWPGRERRTRDLLLPALIEVKFGLTGFKSEADGLDGLAQQITKYYETAASGMKAMAEQLEIILRQKLELGLITGGSSDAIKKLGTLRVSDDPEDLRIVIALIDYSPLAQKFKLPEITKLEFADQIEVFHLGLGLWQHYKMSPGDAVDEAEKAVEKAEDSVETMGE